MKLGRFSGVHRPVNRIHKKLATVVELAPESGYITTDLQMFWDIGNSSSYPGSGTTITDLSGNGRSGTLSGSPTYSSGGLTTGTTGSKYIYAPSNFNLAGAWTVSIVSNTSQTQTQYWATMWGNEAWSSTGYLAYQPSNSSLIFGRPSSSVTWSTTQAAIQGSNTVWDFTYDGTTIKLYKNGVATPVASGAMGVATSSSAGIFFGARHINGGGPTPADFSTTTFYQMRVYSRALTTTEIADNYTTVKTQYSALALP
jgi:hypothetical protein